MIIGLIDPITKKELHFLSAKHHRWSNGTYAEPFGKELRNAVASAHADWDLGWEGETWLELLCRQLHDNLFMFLREEDNDESVELYDFTNDEVYYRMVDFKKMVYQWTRDIINNEHKI